MTTLVLLPGMDGTGDLFAPFVEALGTGVAVKIVRYPTAGSLGHAELEAVAQAALPVDEPYFLLGESFSGPIAVSLAASAGPRLRGLILCCSYVRNPRPQLAWLSGLIPGLLALPRPAGLIGRLLLGDFASQALATALVRAVSQVSSEALGARLRSVATVDVADRFASCNVPTLCLVAARDRLVPRSATRLLTRLKPDAELVELDAPHFLLQAVPAEAARIVRRFIEDHGYAG